MFTNRECSREMNYGYDKGVPCIFLQFSGDPSFHPEVSEGSDIVSIECSGDTALDQENLGGIIYTPDAGFKVS